MFQIGPEDVHVLKKCTYFSLWKGSLPPVSGRPLVAMAVRLLGSRVAELQRLKAPVLEAPSLLGSWALWAPGSWALKLAVLTPSSALTSNHLIFFLSKQAHLLNCPQWNPKIGDDIVCIDEVCIIIISLSGNVQLPKRMFFILFLSILLCKLHCNYMNLLTIVNIVICVANFTYIYICKRF